MKILSVTSGDAQYTIGSKANKPIKDMDSEDVLEIVEYILEGNAVELDPVPDKTTCPHDADRVLYEELHKQFEKLISSKDTIIEEIDNMFEEAEEFYSQHAE